MSLFVVDSMDVASSTSAEVFGRLPAEIPGERLVARFRIPADSAAPEDSARADPGKSLTDLRVVRDPAARIGVERRARLLDAAGTGPQSRTAHVLAHQ
ncbi:hypothetical protein [Streptomyces sp. NPDC001880]